VLSPAGTDAWAREHVHVGFSSVGRTAGTWRAQIKADGLLFEGRATGEAKHARKLEARAVDEAGVA
jgi:hypothetical protein